MHKNTAWEFHKYTEKKVKNNKGNAVQFLFHKLFKILEADENVVIVMCEFIHWKEGKEEVYGWIYVEPNGSLYILKAFNFIDL